MYRQYSRTTGRWRICSRCAPYGRANIVSDGHAEIANAFITTGNYYRMLGLTASPGRTIVPEDDRPNAAPVAVISARYWRSRFGGDPQIVGKAVRFNNVPVTIVGVIVAGARRRAAGRFVTVRTSPCRSRSTLSSRPSRRRRLACPPCRVCPRRRRGGCRSWDVSSPASRPRRCRRISQTVFQNTARAGFDSYLSSLPATTRSSSRYPEPHRGAAAARRFWRTRRLRRQHLRRALGTHPQRRRRARAADRLRERRQSAALACDDAAEGDLDPALARRNTRTAGPPAADREPAARVGRRNAGHSRRELERPAPAWRSRTGDGDRLAGAVVRAWRHGCDRHRVRHRAGASRNVDERQRDAEGNEPVGRRLAQPADERRCSSLQVAVSLVLLSPPACSSGR